VSHAHDGLVPALNHPILLRCLWGSQVPLNSLLDEVVDEGLHSKFPTTVRVESPDLALSLGLCSCLEHHERYLHLVLGAHQRHPHVTAQVINEEEKEHVSHWSAKISMYQLERACRSALGFTGEGETSLFADETAITELINII
jgi:hypothetical protein